MQGGIFRKELFIFGRVWETHLLVISRERGQRFAFIVSEPERIWGLRAVNSLHLSSSTRGQPKYLSL